MHTALESNRQVALTLKRSAEVLGSNGQLSEMKTSVAHSWLSRRDIGLTCAFESLCVCMCGTEMACL